jgi:outer membrane protein assembly factor BamD (BamD/ComL family)
MRFTIFTVALVMVSTLHAESKAGDFSDRERREAMEDRERYLEEGNRRLDQGDYEAASEAFNSAIVLDPYDPSATEGLKDIERAKRAE